MCSSDLFQRLLAQFIEFPGQLAQRLLELEDVGGLFHGVQGRWGGKALSIGAVSPRIRFCHRGAELTEIQPQAILTTDYTDCTDR